MTVPVQVPMAALGTGSEMRETEMTKMGMASGQIVNGAMEGGGMHMLRGRLHHMH